MLHLADLNLDRPFPFTLSVVRFSGRSRSAVSGAPFDFGLAACAQGGRI